MAAKERSAVWVEYAESSVFVRAPGTDDFPLGDLRAVVALAEGMADESPVTIESASTSYVYVDEALFKLMRVRQQRKVSDA